NACPAAITPGQPGLDTSYLVVALTGARGIGRTDHRPAPPLKLSINTDYVQTRTDSIKINSESISQHQPHEPHQSHLELLPARTTGRGAAACPGNAAPGPEH